MQEKFRKKQNYVCNADMWHICAQHMGLKIVNLTKNVEITIEMLIFLKLKATQCLLILFKKASEKTPFFVVMRT